MPGFKLCHNWTLIGCAKYDFGGKTTTEVSKWLAPMIDEITCVINSTTSRLNARKREVAECDATMIEPSGMTAAGEENPVDVVPDVPFEDTEVPFTATFDEECLPFSPE